MSPTGVLEEQLASAPEKEETRVELADAYARLGRIEDAQAELFALRDGATLAARLGLEVHAGHGIDYETVGDVAAIPEIAELNIGHFLIGEAIFVGLGPAIGRMRALMDAAREPAA